MDYTTITDMNILNKFAKILWELPIADKEFITHNKIRWQEKACYFRTEYTFEFGRKDRCCGSKPDDNWRYCPMCGEDIDEGEQVVWANSYKEAIELLMDELRIEKDNAKTYKFYTRLQVRRDVLDKLNTAEG